jgi:hypothetical protein
VIGSTPIGRVDVLTVATPFVKVDVPRVVEPLVKVTVPVVFDGRDAVNTTDWLAGDGLSDEDKVSFGEALVTVWVVVPVAGLLLVSPP